MSLSGVFVASVTPMTRGGDSVDYGCIGALLNYFESKKLDGVVTLGSTGEFSSLSSDEKTRVIAECASTKGRMKMIVGCGSSSLAETLDLAALAAKKNADAILVPPPFYFRTAPAAGIERFFEIVLERAECPVLLYHVPSVTGIGIDGPMLERLARFKTLWGIKDTGGKLKETRAYLEHTPGGVLLGSDSLMLDGLKLGVQGTISACANVVPELLVKIHETRAETYQSRLTEVRNALRQFPSHAALKRWLSFRGVEAGFVRPPLVDLSPDEVEHLRIVAVRYGERSENARNAEAPFRR